MAQSVTHEHADHAVAVAHGKASSGLPAGVAVCLDCQEILARLPLCGVVTTKRWPCQHLVRVDLGHRRCWQHQDRWHWR